ncbi:MAG TPA: glycosyltransferase family 39 protein [Pseudolabrys sp.]|nr:glycosyltransferase family 39 protein [Pseudolabrys sp.]
MPRLAPIHTLRRALIDPAGSERAVLLSLGAYVVLWTIYGTIAKSSQGLHPDMTELIAWSRDLAWGYKHPPLAALIVRLWFSVLPVAEWSYYLLAMLTPAIALWIVWRLSADYLDIEKRVAGLALLMFVPFFNFHALKFNVNTVLMPLWAATTLWFLRSYKSRSALYAALAGLGAAGCMLGKYWSVFLLAGLAVAALIDKRRAGYFRSPAPWITIAAGLAVLAPHLLWLYRDNFAPFEYAVYVHGAKAFSDTAIATLGYLAGSVGYVAVPVLIVLAATRPSRATVADMAWPADTERRLAAAAFWGPLLLPAVGALAGGIELTSLWSMSAWTLLPVLLLSQPAVTVKEIDTRRILAGAVVLPLVMLIASPVIAIVAQRNGPSPATAQANLLASEVERLWRLTTPQPLRFVGGDASLANGVISYAADRPRALPEMPPPDAAELAHSGQAIVCFAEDAKCRAAGTQAGGRTVENEIVRNFLRFPGKPQRYTIFIVPPRP